MVKAATWLLDRLPYLLKQDKGNDANAARDRRRRRRAPAGGAANAVGNDDGEEQHLNTFLDTANASSASSRVQFRCVLRFSCRCFAFFLSVLARPGGIVTTLGSADLGTGIWRRARGGWRKPALRRWWRTGASCG